MSQPFRFKEFVVSQDQCAMKIGTDSILLGAWTSLSHLPDSILDIGSGSGVLSLQMAQRSTAQLIDAVEIDEYAYEQCVENFENSPWGDRLYCYHASIQEFASEIEDSYDLIISNPPFFPEGVKSEVEARNTARFEDALPFEHLLVCVVYLLSEEGRFSTIIPKSEEEKFLQIAADNGLYPYRKCYVQGHSEAKIKRVLLDFGKDIKEPEIAHLTVEIERHKYSDEFKKLTSEFYLDLH